DGQGAVVVPAPAELPVAVDLVGVGRLAVLGGPAVGPQQSFEVFGRHGGGQFYEPGFVGGGGDPGQRSDLGVAQLPGGERGGDQRQLAQPAGHPDPLPTGAEGQTATSIGVIQKSAGRKRASECQTNRTQHQPDPFCTGAMGGLDRILSVALWSAVMNESTLAIAVV